MSETKRRKVHSTEFKAKVGLEALKEVKTINEIGQEYGVHSVQACLRASHRQVGQWKKAIQEQAKSLFEGHCVRSRWWSIRSRNGSTVRSAS
jgi:transposase-like protein